MQLAFGHVSLNKILIKDHIYSSGETRVKIFY